MANDKPTPQPAPKQEAAQKPAAPAAPPPSPAEALATAKQVEELADKLSACADSIHERVMRDIRRSQDQHHGEVPEAEQSVARALLDAEVELRQRADRLYLDAATCIVSSLGRSQQHLVGLAADAAKKIQTITRIGDGITLVARLLGFAAAAATGQVLPILAAADLLRAQLDVVAVHEAPPA
jgi:hypothetical protein